MSGLITRTNKDFYVISPMRKISPLRFATPDENIANSCKKVERTVFIIMMGFLLYIYREFDGLESVSRMVIVYLIAQPLVFLLMWFPKKNIEKYDNLKHGDMIS